MATEETAEGMSYKMAHYSFFLYGETLDASS
jgi:hypothetical protein